MSNALLTWSVEGVICNADETVKNYIPLSSTRLKTMMEPEINRA